jgi:hypothetical protein
MVIRIIEEKEEKVPENETVQIINDNMSYDKYLYIIKQFD